MPPRKSNVSQVSATGDEGTPAKEKERDGISVEDLALPRTMVQRLAKGVLPPNTQIQKDAITAMSKSATVFVNYLSSGANDRTMLASRKTISPTNVLDALGDLEFEAFIPRVEAELRRFNEIQTGKRNEYRRKLKEGKDGTETKPAKSEGGGGGGGEAEVEEGDEGELRGAKRVRREGGEGPEGQLVERPKGKEADVGGDGADERGEEEEGETGGLEEMDGEGVNGREEEGDEDEDEDEEGSEEEDEEEEEERDSVADMDARLNALQAGIDSESSARSQADGGSEDEENSD